MITQRRLVFDQIKQSPVDQELRVALYRLLDQGEVETVEGMLETFGQISAL